MDKQFARLFAPSRHTMQMGRRKMKKWVLEFEPSREQLRKRRIDPLMNWPLSCDTQNQLSLSFDSKEEALAYASKYNIQIRDIATQKATIKPKSYATNFAADRRR